MKITALDTQKKPQILDLVHNKSLMAYVDGNKIISNIPMQTILVSAHSDLENLIDYSPGTIAYTAGYRQMWQKAPNGSWVAFE